MRISDWSSDVCSSDLLSDGLSFVVVAMGIFGLGEVIRNLEREHLRDIFMPKIGGLLPRLAELKQIIMPTLRGTALGSAQIGRASCRERVCQYVYISVVALSLKKKKNH